MITEGGRERGRTKREKRVMSEDGMQGKREREERDGEAEGERGWRAIYVSSVYREA